MSFELALRLCEAALALAIIQRAAEHIALGQGALFWCQVVASLVLLAGIAPAPCLAALLILLIAGFFRFDGPYNGGADKMAFLCALCLCAARTAPHPFGEIALAYLAVQLILSYVVSGIAKLRHADWRSGTALRDVFEVSAYPQSASFRRLGARIGLMRWGARGVIAFECLFPLALITLPSLSLALICAALFHIANAAFFGLNRFVWSWIAAYPALIWLQARLIQA